MADKKTIIDYGIGISLDVSDLERSEKDLNRIMERTAKSIEKVERAEREYAAAQKYLNNLHKQGIISKKQLEQQLNREAKAYDRATRSVQRYNKVSPNNAGRGKQAANILGSGLSGLGMGGAVAGAGRLVGLAAGVGGMAGFGLAGTLGASLAVKKSFREFADYEERITKLNVLFREQGTEFTTTLTKNIDSLAINTALTSEALTEGVLLWRSYGLNAEDALVTMKKIGEAAGGEREQMLLLARALAQVNNMGRLMGQEKNQLVNAGFNLKYVAEAAGVTMEEFQDAMKNGEISAEHVMQALDKMVSRGGTHFGLLNDRAKTLNGSLDRTTEKFNRLFRDIGESERGIFKGAIDGAEKLADTLGRAASYWGLISDPDSIFAGTSADANLETGVTNKDGSVGGYKEKLPDAPSGALSDFAARGMGFNPFYYVGRMGAEERQRARELEEQRKKANQELVYIEAERLARQQAEEDAKIEKARRDKLERDRRKATQARAGAKGAASAALAYQYGGLQGLYNRYATDRPAGFVGPPDPSAENAGIDYRQLGFDIGQGVSSVLPSMDTVGSALGYGMGLLGAENPADRAARVALSEGLARMFAGDEGPYAGMPPALREVFEKRDRKIERLDRRERLADASSSVVGTAGRFGQGGEYEFLSRVKQEQDNFRRQEKRDKERNDKLDKIKENTKNQVTALADTDKAIADYISRQNSI